MCLCHTISWRSHSALNMIFSKILSQNYARIPPESLSDYDKTSMIDEHDCFSPVGFYLLILFRKQHEFDTFAAARLLNMRM